MPIMNKLALVSIFLGAVACSSGGESTLSPGHSDYSSMLEEGTQLGNKLRAHANEMPTMPSKGSADYTGIANLDQNGALYARIALNADFRNNVISGRMDDFTASGDIKINGHADITHGRITGQKFGALLSGILEGETLTGDMGGQFHGQDAEIIAGRFRAEVQGQSYRGDFRAENKNVRP